VTSSGTKVTIAALKRSVSRSERASLVRDRLGGGYDSVRHSLPFVLPPQRATPTASLGRHVVQLRVRCCKGLYVISGAPFPVLMFVTRRMVVPVDLESKAPTCCSSRKDGRNEHAPYEDCCCSNHDTDSALRYQVMGLGCQCHRKKERNPGRRHEKSAPDIGEVVPGSFSTQTRLPECNELRRIGDPKSH
jgi:hypothetical protein